MAFVSGLSCFQTNAELRRAIEDYLKAPNDKKSDVAKRYGHPINKWCFSKQLTDFSWLFWDLPEFNHSIADWDMSNALDLSHMFDSAASFDDDLSKWQTAKVLSAALMFKDATSFRGTGLDKWNVSNLIDARYMFQGASSFRSNLCLWGVQLPDNALVNDMFGGTSCPVKTSPDLSDERAPGPFCEKCFKCFVSNEELRSAASKYATNSAARQPGSTMSKRYGWPIGRWCTSLVTDFSHVFEGLDDFNRYVRCECSICV